MKTAIFKNNARSYCMTALLGIGSGILIVLLSAVTTADCGMPYISTSTFAAWFFACALIALFSETNWLAGVHTALYALCLYLTPCIIDFISDMRDGFGLDAFFSNERTWCLISGLFIAILCYPLAFLLCYGRKQNLFGVLLRFLPAAFMAVDEASCIRIVFTMHRHVLTTVMEGLCLIAFVAVLLLTMLLERKRAKLQFA